MLRIRLLNTLPLVFADEKIPASDIWKSEMTFVKGEKYLVEAESGGGKSSMCAYIFGARTDYQGEILFDDKNIREIGISAWLKLRRESLAYLPQELSLFPELTALENIRLKNNLTGYASDAMISDWMDRLGIAFRSNFPVGKMSIGQQQRVAIIRSLCQPFDFLLIDEPVSHLDNTNNDIAAALISEEAERQGAGIICTSVGNHLHLDYTRRLKL